VNPIIDIKNKLFIIFNLDGETKGITSPNLSISTGSSFGAYTSSGFFIFNNSIDIDFNLDRDSILGADLQALVGQKIRIEGCLGCATNAAMRYEINGDEYRASDLNNTFPANYFKIRTVTFYQTVNKFGKSLNQYYVEGEFDAYLTYGSDNKHATNGLFRLIFEESKR